METRYIIIKLVGEKLNELVYEIEESTECEERRLFGEYKTVDKAINSLEAQRRLE